MITFIPYQKFEIKTRLGQEVARQKLATIVETRKRRWGWSRNHLPFEGEIKENEFKISRIIHYNNNFLPVLDGRVQDDLNASSLQITAHLTLLGMIMWPLFLIGPALVANFILVDELSSFLWTIVPFTLFFYGVSTILFNFELNKAKKILNEQLEADKYSWL